MILEEPQMLLAVCCGILEQLRSSPQKGLEGAEFLYRLLENSRRPIGLFDERSYFLGEAALLGGMACRLLGRRDDSRRWFDRAEASYRLTVNAVAELSRLAYQRLALDLEERKMDQLLELLPPLAESFTRLGMTEDALKCRSLEGLSLMELGELASAVEVFNEIRDAANALGSEQVLVSAYVNLTHLHAMLGNAPDALASSREAVPILQRTGNRIDLAKLQWAIGSLLRSEGQVGSAVEAYRVAQQEFAAMSMPADVAAARLVVADVLLDAGQETQAIAEILAALPVIEELGMVPEGVAALSLLRESVRHQKINRQALRDLHGYFEDIQK